MSNNPTIEILSSVMGSGKTSLLIERIKRAEHPILYIAAYSEEAHRVAEACKGYVEFHEPSDTKTDVPYADYAGDATKTKHLRRLLQAGQSVAATHALFHHLRRDMLTAIQMHGYTLVMDEVLAVANTIGITAAQFQMLVDEDVLRLGPVKSMAKWVCQVHPGENLSRNSQKLGSSLTVGHLHQRAKAGRLMTVDNSIVFWMFPLNFFQAFSSVTVATYLFEGSHLRRYYDLHDLAYRVKAVTKLPVISHSGDQYAVIRPEDFDHSGYLGKMRNQIEIVDDSYLNALGEADGSLSYTWYMGGKNNSAKLRDERIKLVQTRLAHMLNRVVGKEWNKKDHLMFTSFKEVSILPDDGKHPKHPLLIDHDRIPADCFLAHNIKATNKFIGKKTVAYLVNRYMNPFMVRGFEKAGVEINEDHFALSEMLQFIYRSRIRKGWKIKVWIPSKRQRGLLVRWLAGEIQ